MGMLRFILAFGVAAEHLRIPVPVVGSFTAVQGFFIISGFYMSLIYGNAYGSARDFYASRALRIFPVYWAILAGTIAYMAIGFALGRTELTIFDNIAKGEFTAWTATYFVATNLLIFGSDATWFFPKLFGDAIHAVRYLVVSPVWTLGLELVFYALCPLLLRLRTLTIWLLVGTTLAARVIGYQYGLNGDPWHARFIGFEIGTFLIGVLAHRAYQAGGWPLIANRSVVGYSICAALFAYALSADWLGRWLNAPDLFGAARWFMSPALYALIVLALPTLFELTKKMKWDSYIGEYSYPLYLWHYAFAVLIVYNQPAPTLLNGSIAMTLSLIHAALVIHYVQMPVDKIRHRLYRRDET
jgi:peptidoglycan/LPS O-acetylase OafA/YrhL